MVVKRLKAGTLMETIVSMVVLMIVFMICTMVIQNVIRNAQMGSKIKAQMALDEIMEETKRSRRYLDEDFQTPYGKVSKTISEYPLSDSLGVLTVEVKDDRDIVIGFSKEIFLKYE